MRKPAAARAAPRRSARRRARAGKAAVDPELEATPQEGRAGAGGRSRGRRAEGAPPSRKPTTASARADQLATLDSGQRIARINAEGEREILDDEARAEEARRAREVIASDCR